jgi:shikimate kinase
MAAQTVFLIGFMGSGKTTVGRELARRLSWQFVDLDEAIGLREGRSVSDIFKHDGESEFRIAETAALSEVMQSMDRNCVVALGGGAFAQDQNRELLAGRLSVFLQAPVEELWLRCSQDRSIRPLAKEREQFGRLHAERLPFYEQATLTVQTFSKHPVVICAEIEAALQHTEGWTESAGGSSSQPSHSSGRGELR